MIPNKTPGGLGLRRNHGHEFSKPRGILSHTFGAVHQRNIHGLQLMPNGPIFLDPIISIKPMDDVVVVIEPQQGPFRAGSQGEERWVLDVDAQDARRLIVLKTQ